MGGLPGDVGRERLYGLLEDICLNLNSAVASLPFRSLVGVVGERVKWWMSLQEWVGEWRGRLGEVGGGGGGKLPSSLDDVLVWFDFIHFLIIYLFISFFPRNLAKF